MGIEPMNLCKNGNRTHEYVDGVNLNNTTGLKFSSEFMTKGVNLSYSIVWVWESNQEPTQVWNRNPIQDVQRGLEPMTMSQGWLEAIQPFDFENRTHESCFVRQNIGIFD
jgi:hypothetical protein